MDYWYIWYEIYENGKPTMNNKGRYFRPYKYKCNAERRARQMYGTSLYDPRSNHLQERRWIVSQSNPWEDVYIFDTMAEAENTINAARLLSEKYGFATRAEIREIVDRKVPAYNFIDCHYGWMENHIKQARVYCSLSVYILEFPKAIPIDLEKG